MSSDVPAESLAWFDSHTFAHQDVDVDGLVSLKGDRRISVLIPARDEAATVGTIVATIRTELVEAGLVDEIIVIDSHSIDGTAAVAAESGAIVHHVDDVLPHLGSQIGKGEAMWKALAVMTGDLGVYLDADVTDFSAGFVTGLLAPLLRDDHLVFAKAFYDRPWKDAPTGGGRVTELVARQLLLDHVPELAAFVQPLAGECAFRRSALITVPFVSGYGVDIGLLIDVLARHGLPAMCQVDLGLRRHGHQDLAALTVMAQHVRAAVELRTSGTDAVDRPVIGFARDEQSRMQIEVDLVRTTQRPPLADVADLSD